MIKRSGLSDDIRRRSKFKKRTIVQFRVVVLNPSWEGVAIRIAGCSLDDGHPASRPMIS